MRNLEMDLRSQDESWMQSELTASDRARRRCRLCDPVSGQCRRLCVRRPERKAGLEIASARSAANRPQGNAFQHAQGSQVEAEIRYQRRLFCVHVRDNGRGIDPEVLKAGGRDGHWGFTGIRERTKRIGARLDFWSETGAGTEVRLTVPASIAYAAGENGRRFQLRHRKGAQS